VRIAQVSPYSISSYGGVQAQVFGLARALSRRGHEVAVVGPASGAPVYGGVEAVVVGPAVEIEANGSVAPISVAAISALRSLRVLLERRFDVVHLHEPLVPGPTMAILLSAKVPLVGTFHLSGSSASYRYLKPVVRRLVNRLSVRCCVSEEARATAETALGGSYEVLFNGVELDRFASARRRSKKDGDLPQWQKSPAPSSATGDQVSRWPVVAYVGRHEERKGIGVLIEAFSMLTGDEVTLRISGEGPLTADLKAATAADRRIRWLGTLEDEEVASLIAGASVVCAPSLGGESFGVVLVEAMAAGTPVVASDIPGYRAVAGGGAALLVPPGDPAALADALRQVLTDPSVASRLAEAGLERARQFSTDRLAEAYEEIYRGLA